MPERRDTSMPLKPSQKQGLSVLCSISQQHCPSLQIVDATRGYAVAAPNPVGTPLTSIGTQQNESTSLVAGSGSGSYGLSDYSWTIEGATGNPPSVVKGYLFGDQGAARTLLNQTDLTSPALSYYWLEGSGLLGLLNNDPSYPVNGSTVSPGTSTVESSAIAMRSDRQEEGLLSATADFDVDAPDAAAIFSVAANEAQYGMYAVTAPGAKVNPVHVNPPSSVSALSLGTALAYPASSGMETNLTGVMPNSIGGTVAMTQLVQYSVNVVPLSGQAPNPASSSSGQFYVDDGCALYTTNVDGSSGATRSLHLGAGMPISYQTVDSPAQFPVAANDQSLAVAESYQDYYMFRPDGPNTIWVSLANTSWSWTGRVDLGSNGSYGLTYSTSPSNPIAGIVNPSLPLWAGTRASGVACHGTSGS